MNVLLVEDDLIDRETVTEYLRSEGHMVTALRSAREAYGWLDDGHAPDLLIADFQLEGSMTGVDVLKRLRTRVPAASYLCVTGDPDGARSSLSRWLYCEVLAKPFQCADLAQSISAALAHSNA